MKTWTPNPHYYNFGRPFPARHVVSLFEKSKAVCSLAEQKQHLQVCEFGAGTGRILVPLACQFRDWQFYGTDASPAVLEVLNYSKVCESLENLTTILSDGTANFPERKYHLIILSSVLHAIKDWKQILNFLSNCLKVSGLVCLIGEESDLHNEVLGRSTQILDPFGIDSTLRFFWKTYRQIRLEVGATATEESQVGCRWEIMNQEAVNYLQELNMTEVAQTEVEWLQIFKIADLFKIVEERCYSSMFTVEPNIYSNLIEKFRLECKSLESSATVVSRHKAVARFIRE